MKKWGALALAAVPVLAGAVAFLDYAFDHGHVPPQLAASLMAGTPVVAALLGLVETFLHRRIVIGRLSITDEPARRPGR